MTLANLPQARTHTHSGTPVSPNWDPEWIVAVEAAEQRLNRRICGARTIDDTPCTLPSDHPTGRCRFHGGHPRIGAPQGNRNATLHGLFVRNIQDCGPHCTRFERCPLAGDDVAELPATQRPACPYELAEYELSLEDLATYPKQQAHHVVLLQVMIGRAARASAADGSTASLNVFLRLSAEYRSALQRLAKASPG